MRPIERGEERELCRVRINESTAVVCRVRRLDGVTFFDIRDFFQPAGAERWLPSRRGVTLRTGPALALLGRLAAPETAEAVRAMAADDAPPGAGDGTPPDTSGRPQEKLEDAPL